MVRKILARRRVSLFAWQEPSAAIIAFADSDWGGDRRSRRSTSGGCLMRGWHLLAHWSRTQQEAELHAICKGAAEGLAAANMAREFLEEVALAMHTDASAAKGVIQRQGAGRVKHLSIKQLWAQERESEGELGIRKIPRAINWADLLTHHWSETEAVCHLAGMCVVRRP